MDPEPSPRINPRRLLAGAGLAGVLLGLLVLLRTSSGDGGDAGIGVPPGSAPRSSTTTVAPAPAVEDGASVAGRLPDSGDPFRQLVAATGAQPVEGGAEGAQAPAAGVPTTTVGDYGSGSRLSEDDASSSSSEGQPSSSEGPTAAPEIEASPADGGASVPQAPSAEGQPAREVTASSTTEPTPSVPPLAPPTSTLTTAAVTASSPTTSTTTTTPSSTTTTQTSLPSSSTAPIQPPPLPSTTSTTVVKPPGGIAFSSVRDGSPEIYAIDPDGRNERRLTQSEGADREPVWSPDGRKLAFVSDRAGRPEIYVMGAGGESPVRVAQHPGSPASPTWARDGLSIAFESTDDVSGNREIFLLSLENGGSRRLTTGACAWTAIRVCPEGEVAHRQPAFSPDGSRIAFIRSDRAGQRLFVMNADGSAKRALGGTRSANPAWSPDGGKIAYDDVDGVRVADATSGAHTVVPGTFRPCRPNAPTCPVFFEPSWSPDGTRLAVRDATAGPTSGDLHVIDLSGKQQTRLNPGLKASAPAWSSPSR